MSEQYKQAALTYHALPKPGKMTVDITKPMTTQMDLSLAYTPGVAEPVKEIFRHPENAYNYTNKGNLVAVITNGSAVLGLGNVGPLAAKPVMEGKAALFKRYADVDVFDLEIDCDHPETLVDTIIRLAPTFGGINLEDIKAPECFYIDRALKAKLNIPVLHDDQHGTAIVVSAALLNALEIQQKRLSDVKIVCLGAGAAGIATMELLRKLGAKHLYLLDRKGVLQQERDDLNQYKKEFIIATSARNLADAMAHADVFIGVSGPNLLPPSLLSKMNPNPIIFALSNPDPEIKPEAALSIRQDLIIATGRSDYPNQVNNVLCFPYLFRGALDVQATCINEAMFIAAIEALKNLAKAPIPEEVLAAYQLPKDTQFGPTYLLPKPTDPRLKFVISNAVSEAAIKSGVARIK